MSNENDPEDEPGEPTTDYATFVIQVLARSTQTSATINQQLLRHCIGLSSSFLMSDTTMNTTSGLLTWNTGFNRLIDLLVVLHNRGDLELETVNQASKACSECWSVSTSWKGMDDVRKCVKVVARKLQGLLDENGRTYRGESVYAP